VEVRLNGEMRTFEKPLTVARLLDLLGVKAGSVAVERNMRIVPRSAMAVEVVEEGDTIEIIRLVGGG
jgi:thiamine biosynthesis protein ThiS